MLRYFVTPDTRITDISGKLNMIILRFWGSDFIPPLLKFRYKYGEQKGKSIFHKRVPIAMEEKLWKEIEENPEEVFSVIIDDNNLTILKLLEGLLIKAEWLHYLRFQDFRIETSESLPNNLVRIGSMFRAFFSQHLYKICMENRLNLSWDHLRMFITYSDVNDSELEKLVNMNNY